MFEITTFQIYGFLITFILLLDGLEKKHVSSKITHSLVFGVLLVFCVLRYDTTRDYFNYVKFFTGVRFGVENTMEVGWYYLNNLFSPFKYGYIGVFGTASLFCLYAFHRTFKKCEVVYWGWIFAIFMMTVLMLNNQLRQSIAISFFVFSIPYIQKGKIGKTVIVLLLGSLFHFSAGVGIAFYFAYQFFKQQRFDSSLWVIVIIATLLLYLLGFWYEIVLRLYSLVGKYEHYASNMLYNQKEQLSSGLGIILKTFIGLAIAINKNKLNQKYIVFVEMALFSYVLSLCFNDVRVVLRVVRYLDVFVIVALSLLMISKEVQIYWKIFVFLGMFALWSRTGYNASRTYNTIFSNKVIEGEFYNREWGAMKNERELNKVYYYRYKVKKK